MNGQRPSQREVAERAGPHLGFDGIGEIKLKGFNVSTEMFVGRPADEEEYAMFPADPADEGE